MIGWLRRTEATGELVLLAVLWGYGYVAGAQALEGGLTPFLVVFARFLIASVAMALLAWRQLLQITALQLRLGLVSGLLLFVGFVLQTFGMAYTTPSSTNVAFVPFFVWIAERRPPQKQALLGAAACMVGVWVLTGGGVLHLGPGDLFSLAGAVVFAVQIAYIGHISTHIEVKVFNFIQMLTVTLVSGFSFLLFEAGSLPPVQPKPALVGVLYLGVFSTCVCYLLQLRAQQRASASKAALIMSTEALFGTVFSVLRGYDQFSWNLVGGGLIILLSVLVVELDFGLLFRRKGRVKKG
mgnify:CR=1 FL=1